MTGERLRPEWFFRSRQITESEDSHKTDDPPQRASRLRICAASARSLSEYLQITGRTVFPKAFAFTNVLVIFGVLKGVSLLLPISAFRLGFTNGLMSESMVLWFGMMMALGWRYQQ